MARARTLALVIGGVVVGAALAQRIRGTAAGRDVAGGIVMNDAGFYDALTGVLLRSFFAGIAADIATVAPPHARVLEVGCGPGHLTRRLAREGFDVTGVDLDPEMIEHARHNAEPSIGSSAFVAADVASLPFPDASFDLVVSTLSMHHWADRAAGLAEIGRVLRPGGRALVWDLRPGTRPHPFAPTHAHGPGAPEEIHASGLRPVRTSAWRWPLGFALTQRIELARA